MYVLNKINCLVAEERESDHRDSVPDRLEDAVHPEVREEQNGLGVRQDILILCSMLCDHLFNGFNV